MSQQRPKQGIDLNNSRIFDNNLGHNSKKNLRSEEDAQETEHNSFKANLNDHYINAYEEVKSNHI